MPALDLALGLRVIRGAADMLHLMDYVHCVTEIAKAN